MSAYSLVDELKLKQEFSEFCEQLLFRRFDELQLYTGSLFELPIIYFLANVTDIDIIMYHRTICAIKNDATTPKDFKGTVLIIQSEGSHRGFARLHYKNNNMPYTYAMVPEQRPASSETVIRNSGITSHFFSELSHENIWSAEFQRLTRDIVDAIWCPNWPEESSEWIIRNRLNNWPLNSTVKRIVDNGCFLVAKPHRNSHFVGNEWRFSFSEAELILIHTWNDVQMHIYHILRLIKSDVVRKCGGKKRTVLTTYHFKTLMLWACEEKPKKFWLPDNIESSVQELLIVMIIWLIEKKCRNYFIPGNNMLDHLPHSHDFEREVQFLIESVDLVDLFLSSTVPFTEVYKDERRGEFSVRIPTDLLLAVQLRLILWYVVDPSRPGRQRHKPSTAIENTHLFTSDIFRLFQCLMIHRRLVLANYFEEKLNGMHEVEECFNWAKDRKTDGFTYVDISPMDNLHVITAKLARKTLDRSESPKGNKQQEKSIRVHGNSTRRELCYWRIQSIERSHVACIVEILFNKMNDEIVKPFYFQAAAYEANFYWTIFADEANKITRESCEKALKICNQWLCCGSSIYDSLSFLAFFGVQDLPIIISNRWSVIFDKYVQIVLGFLSLVKAITNQRFHSKCKLSNESNDLDVVVHVDPTDLLGYISYQCRFYLKRDFVLDDSFTRDMHNDITRMFLYTAARISTDARQAINFYDD